jgi:hypothetical protein
MGSVVKAIEDRYKEDPVFHYLVSMFYREYQKIDQYGGAGLTPSEIRVAAGYAWQMYAERHFVPSFVRPKEHREA